MRNLRHSFLAAFLFLISLACTAHAIGIGAGPSTIHFSDVLRDGYGEETIMITNPDDGPTYITINVEGDIRDWLSFELGKNFTVPAKSTLRFQAIVKPPPDIQIGTYNGTITITSNPLSTSPGPGMHGTAIIMAAALNAFVHLTGKQILNYTVQSMSIKDTEEGYPIEFFISGKNKGNVRMAPKVHIDIWNRDKTKIVRSEDFIGSEILPTREGSDKFYISSENLSIGQYWANVTVYMGENIVDQRLLTFDLMLAGSLKVKGEFVTIFVSKVWSRVGEVVRLDCLFKNTGELPVSAKFKGEVYLGDEIVAVLESEELIVAVGASVNLTTYFTPEKEGRYVAVGVVFYDKKITFPIEGIINVLPEESILMLLFTDKVFYILIIILLIIILVKVLPRKETDSLSGKYQKLDDILERTMRDGKELKRKIRESKDRFKK